MVEEGGRKRKRWRRMKEEEEEKRHTKEVIRANILHGGVQCGRSKQRLSIATCVRSGDCSISCVAVCNVDRGKWRSWW